MGARGLVYPLHFSGFSIEFEVNVEASAAWTQDIDVPDYVFVVADTWLCTANARHLLAGDLATYNWDVLAENLANDLPALPQRAGIEDVIARGGWGAWMHAYLERRKQGAARADDEAAYDRLSALSVIQGVAGQVAVYRHGDAAFIEAAVWPQGAAPVFVCAEFRPEALAAELAGMRARVRQAVQEAMAKP